MEALSDFLKTLTGYLWGLPTVCLLVGSGIAISILLKGIQIRGFIHGIRVVCGRYNHADDPGEISHFKALCTALSATVGLGNIAGVALAISAGGPGALFWMILSGLFGMATKYAECTLGVLYRRIDDKGVVHGGPMHYIELGLGSRAKPLAIFFALACCVATFGASNMYQTNQVANTLQGYWGVPPWITGLLLAGLTAVVIIGGIKRIGSVSAFLVPFMGAIYVLGALAVIALNIERIPGLLSLILNDAFSGQAVAGGALGEVIRQGIRRAAFSNEAGLGSSPIAHSAVATSEPVREGTVALLEPFIDTVVICTMTALVILIADPELQNNGSLAASGATLTANAFDASIPGFGKYVVSIAISLFAYSTLLSWSYYGERAVDYLFGERGLIPYRVLYCILAFVGALAAFGPVDYFSLIMLALMIFPNLLGVWLLMPKVYRETERYFKRLKAGAFDTKQE